MTTSARLTGAIGDRYRIERELGQGGMATVYLARDLRHDRDVAIKVLHPELGAALGSDRFLSEIKTTAKLQHPHILPLLDSGEASGLLYYVMPLVTGETLRARLTRERQLPIDDALRIAREVADALGHAHTLGIIHRDIKPENVLLQSGHALVADFGIALAVQQAGGSRMTQTGLSLGTPQYMSPEQAMGERSIDARSDIYALGAVTYEMLTGEPPFTGPTIQAIVARVMSEEPRGLTVQRKAIPLGVDEAVLRALEKLPADRFSSAGEFSAALDARTVHTTRATRSAPATRGARRAVIAASAVALTATALALWGWSRPQPAPSVVRYRIGLESVPSLRDWVGEMAISPDGSTLVHTGGENGALLVRRRNELGFTPMPSTDGARAPFFSPDGTQIGFYSNGKLMVAALAGGPPVILADSLVNAEASSWGDDGKIYRAYIDSGQFSAIGRMESKAGAPLERITVIDTAAGENFHTLPDVLPNARGVLFRIYYRNGRDAIAVGDLATKRHKVLLPGTRARYTRSGHLLYTTSDGRLWSVPFNLSSLTIGGTPSLVSEGIPSTMMGPVDFVVSASGTLAYGVEDPSARRELVWVSRDGHRELLDATWSAPFVGPALSPDGTRLAVAIREGSGSHIWIKRMPSGAPFKLTLENDNNDEASWTPDGRSVSHVVGLAVAGSGFVGEIWSQSADGGSKAIRVLANDRPLSEHAWSPLGDWLIVRTTTSFAGAGDILAMKKGADRAAPIVGTRSSEYTPTISPDGRWMAYASNESGRQEIYVVPFPVPGSAKWQVSTRGGMGPRWSRRAGELFYLDLQSNLVAAQVATTPTFSLLGTRVLFSAADFVVTSVSRRNYDVAPDGQRFLMVRRALNAPAQLVVVENWFEELKANAKR